MRRALLVLDHVDEERFVFERRRGFLCVILDFAAKIEVADCFLETCV